MRIVLMGDLHYPVFDEPRSAEWQEAREAFYSSYFRYFFEPEADLYVSLGDFTNLGGAEELTYVHKHVRASGKSFRHVLGNHDCYSMTKAEIAALTGQSRYHAVDTDEAILVFLDTAKELNFETWAGEIDEVQLKWFEDLIERSGDKTMLVFAHHPVYNTTGRSDQLNLSIEPEQNIELLLNKKRGMGIFFCGHNHIHSVVSRNQWMYVQTAAVLDHPAYRIVTMKNGSLDIQTIEIEDAELRRNAAIIYSDMLHFRHNPDHLGREQDRSVSVSLEGTFAG